nr:MAG TPA: hypothetical protein [Caudoviricetes sp.]
MRPVYAPETIGRTMPRSFRYFWIACREKVTSVIGSKNNAYSIVYKREIWLPIKGNLR